MTELMHHFLNLLTHFQREENKQINEIFDVVDKMFIEYEDLIKENDELRKENEALKKELSHANPL